MDAQGHQPGEELADFTEEELLSLIGAGTVGAYAEIYRRYIDDAVARAASVGSEADARYVADDAFLSVLRSLLNGTADTTESLRSRVYEAIDDTSSCNASAGSAPADSAAAQDTDEPDRILTARALSTLPDNWQRILWLREVEHLSPGTVADRLNITAATVERLSIRAQQSLQEEWDRARSDDSDVAVDHRSALIPALLTSPIVIERLSSTIEQTTSESIGPPVVGAASTETAADGDAGSEPEADDAAQQARAPAADGGTATVSVDADADAISETAQFAALDASAAPAQTSVESAPHSASHSAFTMPKPVLIPVIAACIGLLGTLVGLAIAPQPAEHTGIRPGGGTRTVSTADASTGADGKSRGPQSPDDTSSDKRRPTPGSEDLKESASGSRDKNAKSSRPSQDKGGRTDNSPTDDDTGDSDTRDDGDRGAGPPSKDPDDPSPSDSDRPDPSSPPEPTPSEPSSPSNPEPSEPDDPDPTPSEPDDPDPSPSEPSPTPSDDPPPPDSSPTETDEPTSDPAPSGTEAPAESDPAHVAPSTGTSTPAN